VSRNEMFKKKLGIVPWILSIAIFGVALSIVLTNQHPHKNVKGLHDVALTSITTGAQTSETPILVSSTSNQNVEEIPELGIQITVPDSTKDLSYQVSTVTLKNGQSATLAMFSTASLTNASASCAANVGPLGSLEKVAGQYPSSDQYASLDYGQLVKQFSTFYIASGSPQTACSTSTSVQTTSNSQKTNFFNSEATIQTSN